MLRQVFLLLLALSLMACSDANQPSAARPLPGNGEQFVEGTHYTRIEKPVPAIAGRIVVTEFFWYGCSHCEHFEPLLQAWQKRHAKDVVLQRSPAIWRDTMNLHARVYYLVQTLPDREVVHSALFPEIIALAAEPDIQVQNRKLAQFLSKFGVSEQRYNEMMQAAETEAAVQAAQSLMKQAGISGTPTVMVNGKYLVNNKHITSMQQILDIADYLIAKERQLQPAQ